MDVSGAASSLRRSPLCRRINNSRYSVIYVGFVFVVEEPHTNPPLDIRAPLKFDSFIVSSQDNSQWNVIIIVLVIKRWAGFKQVTIWFAVVGYPAKITVSAAMIIYLLNRSSTSLLFDPTLQVFDLEIFIVLDVRMVRLAANLNLTQLRVGQCY